MTETLQQKIDYFTITARQMGSDYYWSSIEPQVNKAIQELREDIEDMIKCSDGIARARLITVLALIGEKK